MKTGGSSWELLRVARAKFSLSRSSLPIATRFFITMEDLVLKSSAFENGNNIPSKFTCDGENINPVFLIENVPAGAKSLVLIMDDPDATGGTTWDHWLLWNISAETKEILENSVPAGAIQGKTSWGRNEYGGPCPPKGSSPHRYMFKLYALDTRLDLNSDSTKADLEKAIAGHILSQTVLTGLYNR